MKHTFENGSVTSQEMSNLTFEPVCCTASAKLKRCYVACSDNAIRALELDTFEFREVVEKTTQTITSMDVSHHGNLL